MCIVLEGCRFIVRWHMRRASEVRRYDAQSRGRPPPICDMTWLETSPYVRVLQYLSQLQAGQGHRMILLWGRSHESFEEWAEAEPDTLLRFRRTCECASAWICQRHHRDSCSMPAQLVGVVDKRRPLDERQELVQHKNIGQKYTTLDNDFEVWNWFGDVCAVQGLDRLI